LCGVFGHHVRLVCERDGYREFACHCGHTFLKADRDLTHITHPAICVVSGHRIRYVASRGGYMEYVCRDCGHPFCFAEPSDFRRPAPGSRLQAPGSRLLTADSRLPDSPTPRLPDSPTP
jgi:hypothetical protein